MKVTTAPTNTTAPTTTGTTTKSIPSQCDYLVIGGGATGMAFVDTLLHANGTAPSVVMVDPHGQPGGQWNDSYAFVQLHQPSNMYGVEHFKLEPDKTDNDNGNSTTTTRDDPFSKEHRATRDEILQYYQAVATSLEQQFNFTFVGGILVDMDQLEATPADKVYQLSTTDKSWTGSIQVNKKVVDARYLQPDLPVHIAPKFEFDPTKIHCVPVNELVTIMDNNNQSNSKIPKQFVVIGGGKTGMDAIVYLLTHCKIDSNQIAWVVPHQAWITARENIGSCMEFLHTCTQLASEQHATDLSTYLQSTEFFQNGFQQWEQDGKVYRMNDKELPTKFKDATLSKSELQLLQSVTNVVDHQGRVAKILDSGALQLETGSLYEFPAAWSPDTTLYLHCSAGAFNYSKITTTPPPIFGPGKIVLQDVYGTPGFCFVGSLLGKLESLALSDEEKNAMCLAPTPDPDQAKRPLGPSGGDIGCLVSSNHGLVQRLLNLRQWLHCSELKDWLVGHRLFNLRHCSVEQMETLVEETYQVLQKANIIKEGETETNERPTKVAKTNNGNN